MKKTLLSIALFVTIGAANAPQLSTYALFVPTPLLHEAKRELALMQTSSYQHKTNVDELTGRFNYDCSGFLDYALQKVAPAAYAEIEIAKPKSPRPLAEDFYNLFVHPNKKPVHWQPIRKVSHVHAGDVVAWLRPIENDSNNTGHVMIVAAEPSINPQKTNEVLIPIIDSTTSVHAQDSRRKGQTGLGTGVIGVIVNSKDEPIAYRWRGGESKQEVATPIAFGRVR